MTKTGGFVIYKEDRISRIELIFIIHFVLKSTKTHGELPGEYFPCIDKEMCAWLKSRLTRLRINQKNQK
jgi:hypothetical protein